MKQDFKKDLEKREKKKSAVKNELHKFHAERLLNIHITYIFSAEGKIPILKKVRTDSSYLGRRRKKKRKRKMHFFLSI